MNQQNGLAKWDLAKTPEDYKIESFATIVHGFSR